MNREEVIARLEAADERFERMLKAVQVNNDRMQHQMERLTLSMEHFMEASRLEFTSFRSEILQITHTAIGQMKEELQRYRIWVLTGALTGTVALLGFVVATFVKLR